MRARALLSTAILAAAFLVGARLLRRATGTSEAHARLFDQVRMRIERDYIDTFAVTELDRRSAAGLVAELHDPYSQLLDPGRLRAYGELFGRADDGVGLQLESLDGVLRVVAPLPDSPAERAGIRPGDRILEIDGRSAAARSVESARAAVRAAPGAPAAPVTLLVERPGVVAHIAFRVTRAGAPVESVRHAMLLAPGVGYVQLALFADASAAELAQTVASLRARGAHAVLLDLRGDPGGSLEQAVGVADHFLRRGQTVVSVRGRLPAANETITDTTAEPWPDLRLALLVDGATASSAELVAGALQDHDRAAIVGSTTLGRGSAQSLLPLGGEGTALRLTTTLWYTPSGRSLRRSRVERSDIIPPRVASAEPPLSTRQAFRTDGGRVVYGGGGITPDLIITPQDSVDGTRALWRTLGKDLPRFREAAASVAQGVAATPGSQGGAVVVTSAMRSALWARVRAMGLPVDRARFDSSARGVDRVLGEEIARRGGSAEAAYRNALATDQVVVAALALVADASSETEVLTRAADRRAHYREDVERSP